MSELFAELRRRPPDADTLAWFRAKKDVLFRDHPETPLTPERRADFVSLEYWPYDRDARVVARFAPELAADADVRVGIETSTGDEMAFSQIGWLEFSYAGQACRLGAYWIHGYAGGLFVPFRDGTSGRETYGGGRYLLDTIKSADLGSDAAAGTVDLDFNYAYHPSCFYDPKWTCPLAPPDNWLSIPIRAGERATPPRTTLTGC